MSFLFSFYIKNKTITWPNNKWSTKTIGSIYDRYGNIVGVVVTLLNKFKIAKSIGSLPENVNFGIKASTLSQFLNASGVMTNWAKRTKPVTNEKLFDDITSKQTVMVVCSSLTLTIIPDRLTMDFFSSVYIPMITIVTI